MVRSSSPSCTWIFISLSVLGTRSADRILATRRSTLAKSSMVISPSAAGADFAASPPRAASRAAFFTSVAVRTASSAAALTRARAEATAAKTAPPTALAASPAAATASLAASAAEVAFFAAASLAARALALASSALAWASAKASIFLASFFFSFLLLAALTGSG